jgi:hypothetical protein
MKYVRKASERNRRRPPSHLYIIVRTTRTRHWSSVKDRTHENTSFWVLFKRNHVFKASGNRNHVRHLLPFFRVHVTFWHYSYLPWHLTPSITFSCLVPLLFLLALIAFWSHVIVVSLLKKYLLTFQNPRSHRSFPSLAFSNSIEPCPFLHQPLPASIAETTVSKCWLLPWHLFRFPRVLRLQTPVIARDLPVTVVTAWTDGAPPWPESPTRWIFLRSPLWIRVPWMLNPCSRRCNAETPGDTM